jgi:hypothetical protein
MVMTPIQRCQNTNVKLSGDKFLNHQPHGGQMPLMFILLVYPVKKPVSGVCDGVKLFL